MKLFVMICVFLCLFAHCTSVESSSKTQILINSARSNKIDLQRGTYTVYYMNKSPLVLDLNLSDDEKNDLLDDYSNISSNKNEDITFQDECQNLPKLYTTLEIKTDGSLHQKYSLNIDCNSLHQKNKKEQEIRKFLKVVYKLVDFKLTNIKYTKSDWIYY